MPDDLTREKPVTPPLDLWAEQAGKTIAEGSVCAVLEIAAETAKMQRERDKAAFVAQLDQLAESEAPALGGNSGADLRHAWNKANGAQRRRFLRGLAKLEAQCTTMTEEEQPDLLATAAVSTA
jgi:hypothetical protein